MLPASRTRLSTRRYPCHLCPRGTIVVCAWSLCRSRLSLLQPPTSLLRRPRSFPAPLDRITGSPLETTSACSARGQRVSSYISLTSRPLTAWPRCTTPCTTRQTTCRPFRTHDTSMKAPLPACRMTTALALGPAGLSCGGSMMTGQWRSFRSRSAPEWTGNRPLWITSASPLTGSSSAGSSKACATRRASRSAYASTAIRPSSPNAYAMSPTALASSQMMAFTSASNFSPQAVPRYLWTRDALCSCCPVAPSG